MGCFGSFSCGPNVRVSLAGVECIVFNEDYMTCVWARGQKPTANYSLYYWYVPLSPASLLVGCSPMHGIDPLPKFSQPCHFTAFVVGKGKSTF